MNEARYNLRNRGECPIQIQLQLASDVDFLTASGGGADSVQTEQVVTDLSDSGSDIDVSALVDHSDQNLSSSPIFSGRGVHKANEGQASRPSGLNAALKDQQYINSQILSQLSTLGARLDSMENSMKKPVKKTNDASKIKKSKNKVKVDDVQAGAHRVGAISSSVHVPHNIPPPSRLREEARIQEEVQTRLRHLADNVKPGMTKLKSQRGGAVDVFVNHKVRWPHEIVLSGQNKDRVTYNQLSPIQWIAGFCRTIREESDIAVREHMLDFVIDLLDDATDFSWASAKASHAVLLCRMEQGKIKNWSETEKIDRVHRAHAQRHGTAQSAVQKSQDKPSSGKVTTCVFYNKGSCTHKQTPKQKVYCINMFVCRVGTKRASPTLTHKLIAVKMQKTNNCGHDPGFESCPQG